MTELVEGVPVSLCKKGYDGRGGNNYERYGNGMQEKNKRKMAVYAGCCEILQNNVITLGFPTYERLMPTQYTVRRSSDKYDCRHHLMLVR